MKICGMSSMKYIIFLFNFIFAVSGLGIIIIGALVLSDVNEFKYFLEGRIITPSILLIFTGIIIFIVAFLGCYGAIKEHYNLLIGFGIALLIICIIELTIGIAAAVLKSDFDIFMKTTLKDSMQKYSESKIDEITWNNVQKKFNCCGINSPTDWQLSDPNRFSRGLPPYCCKTYTGNTCANSDYEAFQSGCYSKIEMKVQKNAKILIGIGIGIAFIEIAGIILSCSLAYVIKKENEAK